MALRRPYLTSPYPRGVWAAPLHPFGAQRGRATEFTSLSRHTTRVRARARAHTHPPTHTHTHTHECTSVLPLFTVVAAAATVPAEAAVTTVAA